MKGTMNMKQSNNSCSFLWKSKQEQKNKKNKNNDNRK